MTYESRLPANYSFGTLTNAATSVDTSLVSADFATRLPSGLSTTVYTPITLQNPSTGAFEIVWANAHAASATAITCLRGREATTALTWPAGTLWTLAPTVRDGVLPVANRAALPTDPHVGMRAYIQDEQATIERFLPCWGPPSAQLRQIVAQSVPNNIYTAITFSAEDYDNAGGHDNVTTNTRYTIKQAGRYQLSGAIGIVFNAAGQRAILWWRNGVAIPGGLMNLPPTQPVNTQTVSPARTLQVQCAVNDYIEFALYQDSGAALSTNATTEFQCTMTVHYVGS